MSSESKPASESKLSWSEWTRQNAHRSYSLGVVAASLGAIWGGITANEVPVKHDSVMVGVFSGLVLLISKLIHQYAVLDEKLRPKWEEGTRMATLNLHLVFLLVPIVVAGSVDYAGTKFLIGKDDNRHRSFRLLYDLLGGILAGLSVGYIDDAAELSKRSMSYIAPVASSSS